jgi:glycerol-3-phosphate dehydrogenase
VHRHGTIQLDAVILGGGAAGLWTLDELVRRGYAALLIEREALGTGQTIASQGIIHGGLKYTLSGLITDSASAIRQMPALWRECLAGRRLPDLRGVRLRAEFCHLWRTESLSSRAGMIGARVGLRVKPVPVARSDRPAALAGCPGTVARLDEPVIDPVSLLHTLAASHLTRILRAGGESDVRITAEAGGVAVHLRHGPRAAAIAAGAVILTAGSGNAMLRRALGLSEAAMQRRPLHMVMVRGHFRGRGPDRGLPELNGHCVDGARTRITVTSDRDAAGRTVWQIGGQLAEEGVAMEPDALIEHAQREVDACLNGFEPGDVEWATYLVDRAEGAVATGGRPDDVMVMREGCVISAWPTKLALVPRLAERIAEALGPPRGGALDGSALEGWPRPGVARPPWERPQPWRCAEPRR